MVKINIGLTPKEYEILKKNANKVNCEGGSEGDWG